MSREFWVWPDHGQCREFGTDIPMPPSARVEPLRVIEYLAYKKLLWRMDKVELELKKRDEENAELRSIILQGIENGRHDKWCYQQRAEKKCVCYFEKWQENAMKLV